MRLDEDDIEAIASAIGVRLMPVFRQLVAEEFKKYAEPDRSISFLEAAAMLNRKSEGVIYRLIEKGLLTKVQPGRVSYLAVKGLKAA